MAVGAFGGMQRVQGLQEECPCGLCTDGAEVDLLGGGGGRSGYLVKLSPRRGKT